jgi:hypothetical protein
MEISEKTKSGLEIMATLLTIGLGILSIFQIKRTQELQKAQIDYFKHHTK